MNVEKIILDIIDGVSTIDFNTIMRYFGGTLALFWFVVVWWVWNDSRERSKNIFFSVFSVLLAVVLNILGLVIYLILRPKMTADEEYWGDLERRYLKYETADLDDCSSCGVQLQPGFVYCPNCKEEVKLKCPKCEVMIDKNWKHCAFCGTKNKGYIGNEIVEKIEPKIRIWDTFLVGLREWGRVIDSAMRPKDKQKNKKGVKKKKNK